MNWHRRFAIIGATAIALMACSESTPEPAAPPQAAVPAEPTKPAATAAAPVDPAALAERGRQVYSSTCIACHNADPSQEGGLGPAIANSSVELLEARVLRGEYPEGYTPKRDSNAMVALPYLEPDIRAIAAFLAQ